MWLCDDENELEDPKQSNHNAHEISVHLSEKSHLSKDDMDDYTKIMELNKSECKPIGYYVNRRESGLFPAPLPQDSEVCEKACRYFWFLGVFLAKVLQDMRLVDLPLSSSFLQLLCHSKMPQQNTSSSCVSKRQSSEISHDDLMMLSIISEESTDLTESCLKLLDHTNNDDCAISGGLLHQPSSASSKWYDGILSLENLAEIDPIRYEFIKMLQQLLARKQLIESNSQLSSEQKQMEIHNLKLKTKINDEETEVHLSDLAMNFVYLPTSAVYGYQYAELIPNGIDMDVNIDNLEEYCDLLVHFMLQKGIAKQLDAFHNGFCQVFSLKKLEAFSPVEVRMMICGEQHPQWTREDLINYTEPKLGYSKDRYSFFFTIIILVFDIYLINVLYFF